MIRTGHEEQDVTKDKSKRTSSDKGSILVTIRTREGLCIQKKGLDNQGLKTLVEKLESIDLEGMDADHIKSFALFLYEENQNKRKQLDEMIARLDEIVKDLNESNKKIDSLTNALCLRQKAR